MKAFRWVLALAIVLGLAGCGASKDATMPDVTGQKLNVAKDAIKDAGYDDKVKVQGGGVFGVIKESNWQVCKQSPKAGEVVTDTPRLTVDRTCDKGGSKATETPSRESSDSPSPQSPESDPDQILSVANSPDLATLLKNGDDDSVAKAFAEKFAGRTIRFDGYIADIAPHEDTHSRFDFLIYAGNAPDGGGSAPAFQLRDVGALGGVMPKNSHDNENVRVTALVVGFNTDTSLLYLNPVSVKERKR